MLIYYIYIDFIFRINKSILFLTPIRIDNVTSEKLNCVSNTELAFAESAPFFFVDG